GAQGDAVDGGGGANRVQRAFPLGLRGDGGGYRLGRGTPAPSFYSSLDLVVLEECQRRHEDDETGDHKQQSLLHDDGAPSNDKRASDAHFALQHDWMIGFRLSRASGPRTHVARKGEGPDRGEYGAGERPEEHTAKRLRWQFVVSFFWWRPAGR